MTLAYYDSFAGLVPCRIAAVGDWNDRYSDARIQFTASRGAYRRGEWSTVPLNRVVPRTAVFTRSGARMVRRYKWPAAARSAL
jgi:hypothetical protein